MSETHSGNQPEKVKKAFLRSERKGKNVQQKSSPPRLPLPPPPCTRIFIMVQGETISKTELKTKGQTFLKHRSVSFVTLPKTFQK